MVKLAMLLVLIQIWTFGYAYVEEWGSLSGFLYKDGPGPTFDNWMAHLAEGIADPDYNQYAPYDVQTNNFGDFVNAGTDTLAVWGQAFDQFLDLDLDGAQAILDGLSIPYEAVKFHDSDSGRLLYMLREIPDTLYYDDNGTVDIYDDESGAFTYGWGLFVYAPESARPAIVTVPHPCDDFPAPAFACEAFRLWNAQFLLIAGAGREVSWTNVGLYSNEKSLSDPARNAAHPFNDAYKRCADLIRVETGRREWSAQIHSYDWNAHAGYANVQVSAGKYRVCPNLPIRDLSDLKHDLINSGHHVMVAANEVGDNSSVLLNQFYAVQYSVHDFTFSDGLQTYAVNSRVDLPGYASNQQMLYTLAGWNDYDSFEPFFHVEMDELPNSYSLTIDNYKWFYRWDHSGQSWDLDNLFTKFLDYYERWSIDLESVLVEVFPLDDHVPPSAPSSLQITGVDGDCVSLSWTESSAFDFHSYELLHSDQHINPRTILTVDRDDYASLASQDYTSVTVSGIDTSLQHYFRLRALDKNGLYSPVCNEARLFDTPTVPVIALPDSFSFDLNGSLTVDLGNFAWDEDGDPLTLACSGNAQIQAQIDGLAVSFSASEGWHGREELTFTVSDGTNQASDQVWVEVVPLLDLSLEAGWNLVSSWILPINADLSAVFGPLMQSGQLVKIQDEAGRSLHQTIGGGWQNDIGSLSLAEGYYVNVNQSCTLRLRGTAVALPLEIDLRAGWNIVPYPYAASRPATEIFAALMDSGLLIKAQDERGGALYQTIGGDWANNIGELHSGEGYYLRVGEACTLTYPLLDRPEEARREKPGNPGN